MSSNIIAEEDRIDPARDAPATVEESASINFEPLQVEIDDFDQFGAKEWGEECRNHSVLLLSALATLQKTKAELVEATSRLIGEEGVDAFFDGVDALMESQGRFERLAKLLGAAGTRQMIAAAALGLRGDTMSAEPEGIGFGEHEPRT